MTRERQRRAEPAPALGARPLLPRPIRAAGRRDGQAPPHVRAAAAPVHRRRPARHGERARRPRRSGARPGCSSSTPTTGSPRRGPDRRDPRDADPADIATARDPAHGDRRGGAGRAAVVLVWERPGSADVRMQEADWIAGLAAPRPRSAPSCCRPTTACTWSIPRSPRSSPGEARPAAQRLTRSAPFTVWEPRPCATGFTVIRSRFTCDGSSSACTIVSATSSAVSGSGTSA